MGTGVPDNVLKETQRIQKYICIEDEMLRECLKNLQTTDKDQAEEVPL